MSPEKRVRELRTELMPYIAREIPVDPPGLSRETRLPRSSRGRRPALPMSERALCRITWHRRTPLRLCWRQEVSP